jgi:hypothetical protein
MVYAKWTKIFGEADGLLQPPLISFQDLGRDGHPELVVQERVHNGTVYNAVVYHYFHIAADLSLRHILALEARVVDIDSPREEGLIIRAVTVHSPGEVLVETWIQGSSSSRLEKVGEAALRRTTAVAPFRVVERRAVNARYQAMLITVSGRDDDDFLAKGYTFWY